MRLSELLQGIDTSGYPELDICGITCDSRQVQEGWLFVAIPGGSADGHRFTSMAAEKGAAAILAEHPTDCGKPEIVTSNTRAAFQVLCANFFGHPERAMRFLAVTGTNGKTSSSQFVKSILDGMGIKAGLIGTVHNQIGGETFPAAFTTPEPYQLYELLSKMKDAGVQTVVMEVSSQAMHQHRVDSLPFVVAGFTNLTQDHLDYHKTMENYRDAKARLFDLSQKNALNLDDETGRLFASQYGGLTYSATDSKADLWADEIEISVEGVRYRMHYQDSTAQIKVSTPGMFTVHNTLCAAGMLLQAGYGFEEVVDGVNRIPQVPGRAEVITQGLPFTVMLDYAHTPDALENILSTLKAFAKGRIVTLFGCGGDRDKTKRPLMAKAAARFSDFLIITSDNPRTEDPAGILKDIMAGLEGINIPHIVIENRKEAIGYAIANAQPDDLILLAGKGHENYQILNTGVIRFDEKEIVKEFLEQA